MSLYEYNPKSNNNEQVVALVVDRLTLKLRSLPRVEITFPNEQLMLLPLDELERMLKIAEEEFLEAFKPFITQEIRRALDERPHDYFSSSVS
ncbi:hypothetical protein BLNAU_9022 [Blattamonas nauphoetae]|uniref:DUF1902 domain-containing protein n=1 Tax=Blattamonas nauphoetae TaxID=2049346 RepID=A0ABQ9XX45_9EUKA|nr:hypothetical protein BLNAU_9022 [Blattamonas nauphoetae]